MGIDIYARWNGQSTAEQDAQLTGFSIEAGDVGYLREAYHGGPYVTKYLVAEAFEAPEGEAAIRAKTLRERLAAAVLMHMYREHTIYGQGKNPAVIDLAKLPEALLNVHSKEVGDLSHRDFVAALKPESIETAKQLIENDMLSPSAKAFVDFVTLCERKEHETGTPCIITASY
jgi:hypothetical protein